MSEPESLDDSGDELTEPALEDAALASGPVQDEASDSAEADDASDSAEVDDASDSAEVDDVSDSAETDDADFGLDDLGAAYAEAMVDAGIIEASEVPAEAEQELPEIPVAVPTPEGVVEAALFLGHPENKAISARELARVMRDVSPREIESIVERLNEQYAASEHAVRIEQTPGGFRMVLSPEAEPVRRVFYGRVREARLSQAALEILSLVAYQPGISAPDLMAQRGKDCGPLLNQLVRRNLLLVTRKKPEEGGRAVATYEPTQRFLNLFGLGSLDDLPQVDEGVSAI